MIKALNKSAFDCGGKNHFLEPMITTIALKPPENNFLIREIHDQPIKEDNFEPLNVLCVMCSMMFTANYHLNRTNTVTLILHWEEHDTKTG